MRRSKCTDRRNLRKKATIICVLFVAIIGSVIFEANTNSEEISSRHYEFCNGANASELDLNREKICEIYLTPGPVGKHFSVPKFEVNSVNILNKSNFARTRTYSEVLHGLIGPSRDTRSFRDKLFDYLSSRAKITRQFLILLLTEYVDTIKPSDFTLEHQLSNVQEDVLVPFKIQYPTAVWKRKSLPLLTVAKVGGLGNVMGEYATLYALRRVYNVSVMLNPELNAFLLRIFPQLSIQETLSVEDCNNATLWFHLGREGGNFSFGSFELAAAGLFGPKMFFLQGTSMEIHLFKHFYEDLKKDFTFSERLQKQADVYLCSIMERMKLTNASVTWIGFHIRRTDYARLTKDLFGGKLPGNTYFKLALSYYRSKFKFPIFVATSDDPKFVQESIIGKQKDVYISKGKSAEEDMATLVACNHSIVTTGTYGFWAGYLAGGEVVYPVDTENKKKSYRITEKTFSELNLAHFTALKF